MDVSASHSFVADSRDHGTSARLEQSQLDALLSSIRACRACVEEFGHEPRPVVQVTSDIRLLICGQAPGRRVHESGLPFDDPSGDRLREWLGLDRRAFYADTRIGVAPMAFCFPGTNPKGGDYPPPPRCAALWRQSLLACLPRVELTLLGRRLCSAVGAAGHTEAFDDRDRRGMAHLWARSDPAPAPLVAQCSLAAAQPMVQG